LPSHGPPEISPDTTFPLAQVNEDELTFPAYLRVDYVRVYQPAGSKMTTSCSPDDWPTYEYIQNNIDAYSNPNLTTWKEYGGTFPDNRLTAECT